MLSAAASSAKLLLKATWPARPQARLPQGPPQGHLWRGPDLREWRAASGVGVCAGRGARASGTGPGGPEPARWHWTAVDTGRARPSPLRARPATAFPRCQHRCQRSQRIPQEGARGGLGQGPWEQGARRPWQRRAARVWPHGWRGVGHEPPEMGGRGLRVKPGAGRAPQRSPGHRAQSGRRLRKEAPRESSPSPRPQVLPSGPGASALLTPGDHPAPGHFLTVLPVPGDQPLPRAGAWGQKTRKTPMEPPSNPQELQRLDAVGRHVKAADPRDSPRTPGARGMAQPAPRPPGGRPRRRTHGTSLPLLAESPPSCEVLLAPQQASASLPQTARRASPACGLQGAHSGSGPPRHAGHTQQPPTLLGASPLLSRASVPTAHTSTRQPTLGFCLQPCRVLHGGGRPCAGGGR